MESPLTPLADYFWIAGVEKASLQDSHGWFEADTSLAQVSNVEDGQQSAGHFGQVEETIHEGTEPRSSTDDAAPSSAQPPARHSRQNSANRLSKASAEGRLSILTLKELEGTASNRSSATIRPAARNSTGPVSSSTNSGPGSAQGLHGNANRRLGDFDFDSALMKFAYERESFLEDLTFSAGAKLQEQKPMVNPRTERIKADDGEPGGPKSPLGSWGSLRGSIRRKMSFRDMASNKRQPVVPKKAASVRTAKRLSNYNSVIPPPEPLNMDPEMHPLRRRFEPVLLDRYPSQDSTEEVARRGKFPDYVPMFAFPNDIQVVSSDERPRSTWHGFTMTSGNNSKIYGLTVIVWTAVEPQVAEEIERRCERWRQNHMSNEERELASSLGVRLATERAHLSRLLAQLPTVPSGSVDREILDDQISTVEEKIALMAEMLRPLRHGAASKIDGLTAGETGLWTPRAFGVLGKDGTKMAFWREWLRAVIVPMTDGAVLRVPPSSPRVGRWQPLERYVVNLCTEAFSPLSSITQVELGVRELRLYARTEAANELPGSRNIDLYSLFRSLSLENIVALYEYAMSESRIILLSSHTAMLHLATHALLSLLYPLKWAGILIPVLPARLLSVLEAPCPYIVGVERRYENMELPDDDYVLVDLDQDSVEATSQPFRLPRQHRRKLMGLLQIAAPHRLRFGVPAGPPPHAMEAFPYDAFTAENSALFKESTPSTSLGKWVTQNSSTFGEQAGGAAPGTCPAPIFNAFLHSKPSDGSKADPRPPTAKSNTTTPPSSVSPMSTTFPTLPTTPVSRPDSGFATSTTLREKRSNQFGGADEKSHRSSSFGVDKHQPLHRPSLPFLNGHGASLSVSAISMDSQSSYRGYAPSTYAQSTLAASTVMPNMMVQSVQNTDTTVWVEGHCFNWKGGDASAVCTICDDRFDGDGFYKCTGCACFAHSRCLGFVSLVCPQAFHADQVRAAFVRCQASLLFTYRKFMGRPSKEQKANGQVYAFDMDGFIRSLPHEQHDYANMMRETQAFNEFIHERERQSALQPGIRLFDEIIAAKKARGRPTLSGLSRLSTIRMSHGASDTIPGFGAPPYKAARMPGFLSDTGDHIWRTASVPVPNAKFPGDYRTVTTRIPSKLDPTLMKEPRAIQGVPRPDKSGAKGLIRKKVAGLAGGGKANGTG